MRWVAVLSGLFMLAFATAPAAASFRGGNGLLAVQPVRGAGVLLVKWRGRVAGRVCARGSGCGAPGPVRPRWSPDGRALALSPAGVRVPAQGVALVYPDGTCLDCRPNDRGMAAFTPNPAVVTVVRGGALIKYGIDGIRDGEPVAHGVVDSVWSSTGALA